jgi:NitT/TauT family transport system permease protein
VKKKKKSFIDIVKMVSIYIAIIALWQISYWLLVDQFSIVKAYIFPSPLGVANSFVRLIENNLLFFALLGSFRKLLIGLSISILLGVVLGLLLLRHTFLEKLLKPLILGFQTLPNICLVPFALLWFGLNDTATIFVIVIGSIFSICISFETAIKSVNPMFEKAARTMGANSADVFFKVTLPASLPECIAGLKHGWSFAWRALIAGEMVSGTIGGLGYVLLIGRELLDINQIMLVIIILIIISVAVEKLLLGKIENIARKRMGQI